MCLCLRLKRIRTYVTCYKNVCLYTDVTRTVQHNWMDYEYNSEACFEHSSTYTFVESLKRQYVWQSSCPFIVRILCERKEYYLIGWNALVCRSIIMNIGKLLKSNSITYCTSVHVFKHVVYSILYSVYMLV